MNEFKHEPGNGEVQSVCSYPTVTDTE